MCTAENASVFQVFGDGPLPVNLNGQNLPTELDERGIMLLFLYAKGVLRRKHGQTEEPVRALLLPDDNDEQSKQRMRRLVLEKSAGQSQLAGSEYFFFLAGTGLVGCGCSSRSQLN